MAKLYSHGFGFITIVAILIGFWWKQNSSITSSPACKPSQYITRILSYDPLMLHLENFLYNDEIDHLLKLAEPRYKRSRVSNSKGNGEINDMRTSSTAILPDNDPVVRCVMDRAAQFQGFTSLSTIEPLQTTRYEHTQYVGKHYDWSTLDSGLASRLSTFFVTLNANCDSCGTSFPLLKYNWEDEDKRLCQYVDCGMESLTIKPVVGNAVFWRNVHVDGKGHNLTVHAGLPVGDGSKIGLNIWTDGETEWR